METQLKTPSSPDIPLQLPLLDLTVRSPHKIGSRQRAKVEMTLAKLRQLHDELNSALYAQPTERPTISSPIDAANLIMPFIGNLDHEELWVILLDVRNRVLKLVKLYQGSINSSQVRIAEVFRQAIIENAPAIILAHDHPSGDPTPSPDDLSVTRAAFQAGKLLDVDLLDHMIIGQGRWVSMKERGLGFS
jgi:DNA repair protein RadC